MFLMSNLQCWSSAMLSDILYHNMLKCEPLNHNCEVVLQRLHCGIISIVWGSWIRSMIYCEHRVGGCVGKLLIYDHMCLVQAWSWWLTAGMSGGDWMSVWRRSRCCKVHHGSMTFSSAKSSTFTWTVGVSSSYIHVRLRFLFLWASGTDYAFMCGVSLLCIYVRGIHVGRRCE